MVMHAVGLKIRCVFESHTRIARLEIPCLGPNDLRGFITNKERAGKINEDCPVITNSEVKGKKP
eukprot:9616146-Ditylum_brightwellii.AAC.1